MRAVMSPVMSLVMNRLNSDLSQESGVTCDTMVAWPGPGLRHKMDLEPRQLNQSD